MLLALDLVGIFVFAISGGLVAVRNRLDIVGVVVLAITTGLGGGLIRDVLIGATPPALLQDWWYVAVAAVGGLVIFWWHPALGRFEGMIQVFDAAGLGLFCVAGALKAWEYGLGPVPAAILGMTTGVGGGAIRDLMVGRVPTIFSQNEVYYAVPALVGAAIFVVGLELGAPLVPSAVGAAVFVFCFRMVAVRRNWTAPAPRMSA